MKSKLLVSILVVGLLVGLAAAGCPAPRPIDFPTRPITILIGFGAGGGTDLAARAIGAPLEKILGVSLIYVNMPGGAASIAEAYLQKQPADGYTILCVSGDLPINLLVGRTKYTVDDFVHVARVQQDVGTIMINPKDKRFTNLDEFIAYAKKTPVTIGGTGAAGLDEIAVSRFVKAAGIKVTYVPYERPGMMHAALLAGDIDAMHEEPGPVVALLDAQKVKPIIVFAKQRVEGFKDTPAAGERGWDITDGRIRGFLVRRGTPRHIVERLESAIKEAYESPEYKKWEREQYLHLVPGWGYGAEYTEQTLKLMKVYEEILRGLGLIK